MRNCKYRVKNTVFRHGNGQTEWPPEYRDLFHPSYKLPIKDLLKFDIDINVEIKEFPISNKPQTFLNHALDIYVQNFDVQEPRSERNIPNLVPNCTTSRHTICTVGKKHFVKIVFRQKL